MRPERPPSSIPNDTALLGSDAIWARSSSACSRSATAAACASSYCPSFPELFKRVDGYVDARARRESTRSARRLQGGQRPLLSVQALLLQVPVHAGRRARIQRSISAPDAAPQRRSARARDGITLQDRVLGEPQLVGALAAARQRADRRTWSARTSSCARCRRKRPASAPSSTCHPSRAQSLRNWFDEHAPGPTQR